MRIIITGVSSFVGCHLARHFSSQGHQVFGTISRSIENYTDMASARLSWIDEHLDLVQLDLFKPSSINKLVEKISPDLWVHHAGYATNYASYKYDMALAETINISPLSNLYSALKGGNCGVIITGSSAEYSSSFEPNQENDIEEPGLPYGVSKLAQTRRAAELSEVFNVPTRVARLYIPFGKFDNPSKLVAQVLTKLRNQEPIELSPCNQRRDFIGITDVCTAYSALALDLPRIKFDIFNIASGRDLVLKTFLIAIAQQLGVSSELLRFGAIEMRQGEPQVSYGCISKAKQLLNWSPASLEEAIIRDLLS